jgi:hypothetical protein
MPVYDDYEPLSMPAETHASLEAEARREAYLDRTSQTIGDVMKALFTNMPLDELAEMIETILGDQVGMDRLDEFYGFIIQLPTFKKFFTDGGLDMIGAIRNGGDDGTMERLKLLQRAQSESPHQEAQRTSRST